MDRELAQSHRHIRILSRRVRLIDLRRSARWVLDRFGFGSGTGERLAAAVVLAALFFLGLLAAAAATGQPLGTALGLGGVALVTAVVTSTVLVLGPSDDQLIERRADVVTEIDGEAERVAELEQAVAEREAEAADRRARREERRRRTCPYCGGSIRPGALKCPHCREYLDEELARERELARRPQPNTGLAAVMSFLIPGLGQLYKGQVFSGLVWFVIIQGLYAASLLTLVCLVGIVGLPIAVMLHLICVFDAASGGS